MDPEIRAYDPERDADAVTRMWREVGWVEHDEDPAVMRAFLGAGAAEVAVVGGEAEALAHRTPGTVRYQDTDLPLCAVSAVTTSHVARRKGLATTLTARLLDHGRREGAAVAALGAFEQGFYDRLGFGTGAYVHTARFDPAALLVDHVPYRTPVRLTVDDHQEVHDLFLRRHRVHGGIALDGPGITRAEMSWASPLFALGLRADDGRLTHAVFGEAKGESGPYSVTQLAYEEPGQILDILRLLRELSDQVATVKMREPGDVPMHDLLREPFRAELRTRASDHENGVRAAAWTQLRILDMAPVVAARVWTGTPVRFALRLTDPLAGVRDAPWGGVGGDYTVTVGSPSSVEPGRDPAAPELTASVNAFTRMWFGVRPATSLAITDELDGPADLLRSLDAALALPAPDPGIDF